MVRVLPTDENEDRNKHVESVFVPCLDAGSTPAISTSEGLGLSDAVYNGIKRPRPSSFSPKPHAELLGAPNADLGLADVAYSDIKSPRPSSFSPKPHAELSGTPNCNSPTKQVSPGAPINDIGLSFDGKVLDSQFVVAVHTVNGAVGNGYLTE